MLGFTEALRSEVEELRMEMPLESVLEVRELLERMGWSMGGSK